MFVEAFIAEPVEAFIAEPAVEALDNGDLDRLAGLDEVEMDAAAIGLLFQRLADHLRSVHSTSGRVLGGGHNRPWSPSRAQAGGHGRAAAPSAWRSPPRAPSGVRLCLRFRRALAAPCRCGGCREGRAWRALPAVSGRRAPLPARGLGRCPRLLRFPRRDRQAGKAGACSTDTALPTAPTASNESRSPSP